MTRKPVSFTIGEKAKPKATQKPSKSKNHQQRKPKAIPMAQIKLEPEDFESPDAPAIVAPSPDTMKKAIRWGALFVSAFSGLIMMWASVTFVQMIENLFARSPILGWIGTGLLSLAALAALVILLREIFGLFALRKITKIHASATEARLSNDKKAAKQTMTAIKKLYSGRDDLTWALKNLASHQDDIIDPSDRIDLIERDIMATLDEQAGQIIAAASRRVTLLTAITPAAILDILFVAAQNLKMLRRLATLYGGRPGTFGTFKLAGMVLSHLAVAGGLALTDGLVQTIIGKGLLGRLSARFGEGAVNGILTSRIGLAALDLTRPIPFSNETRPALSEFLKNTVSISGLTKTERVANVQDEGIPPL